MRTKSHCREDFMVKMGKFCLQMPNITSRAQKTASLIVNFLKRRFDRCMNSRAHKRTLNRFSKIVFLDITTKLCYYIIYIWENSAQNCPIGGVCLNCRRERISWSRSLRARARRHMPDRAGDLRTPKRRQTKAINGQKSC